VPSSDDGVESGDLIVQSRMCFSGCLESRPRCHHGRAPSICLQMNRDRGRNDSAKVEDRWSFGVGLLGRDQEWASGVFK
jgi:hypothetical protein